MQVNKTYSNKRKENNRRFPPETITFVVSDHTTHHLTCTAPLLDCRRQSSNSFVYR
jgi:hypothetical protein